MHTSLDLRRQLPLLGLLVAALVWFNLGGSGGAGSPAANVREVSPAQASVLIESGALVVDVRGPEAYANRHIPGAIRLDEDQVAAGKLAIARDQPGVVYCGDGVSHGPDSTALLNRAGFANAVNLRGGIDVWEHDKWPVAKG